MPIGVAQILTTPACCARMNRSKRGDSAKARIIVKKQVGKEISIMTRPRYPSLYQINTRVRLSELAAELGRPATLDDISNQELDYLKRMGFDLVWLLGVWQTGPAGRKVSLSNPEWLEEYHRVLP